MITKYNKFDKLYESLPRQTTVDQLKRIRDEINKSQDIKVGPEHTRMTGDVGDRVIDDLVKHKGKQEMNNLFWWDNPLDRHIDSYETFIQDDNKKSLGYTKDAVEKSNRGTDIPNRPESEVPKPKKKTLGKEIIKETLNEEFNFRRIDVENELKKSISLMKSSFLKFKKTLTFVDFENFINFFKKSLKWIHDLEKIKFNYEFDPYNEEEWNDDRIPHYLKDIKLYQIKSFSEKIKSGRLLNIVRNYQDQINILNELLIKYGINPIKFDLNSSVYILPND